MKTTPLTHQKQMIPVLEQNKNYALLWDMGTGKTWMGCYLLEKYFNTETKYLIICPNSVSDTWYKQILEHTEIQEYYVNIIRGTANKKKRLLEDSVISIINYEGLVSLQKELLAMYFSTIIADESHRIKTPKAQVTKISIKLNADRKYILTGTPLSKNYLDVFSQWYFIDGGKTFGKSYFAFRSKYFYDDNALRFKGNFPEWKLKPNMEKVLHKKLSEKSHRLEKTDVLDLPPKIYSDRYCFLSKEQKQAYKELKEECITVLKDNTITAQVALTKIIRLNQITSGFLKGIDDSIIKFENNAKLNLCKEVVEEILQNKTNKIIIWAHYIYDTAVLMKTFKEYNPVCIRGGAKNRGDLVDKFQNDDSCRIFIGNPKAAGEGITLTKANYVIRYSYDYNYINWAQSEDRNHRAGSQIHKSINYINLIAKDTIDEVILESLKRKNQPHKRF